MTFWIIALVIALLAAAPLALAFRRARGLGRLDTSKADVEMSVYRDQLSEVDRDFERGVFSPEDAKRAKLEISRRLLETDAARPASHSGDGKASLLGALALGGVIISAGLWLYSDLGAPNYEDLPLSRRFEMAAQARADRPAQIEAEATARPAAAIQEPDARHLELLEKLRSALIERPDDLQGYMLLARNEAVVGNYKEAYTAQQEVVRLKAAAATADDYADLADMMILAAGGFVSPEAENALSKALSLDPQNGPAIYYSGLMFAQTGRPDMTFRLWSGLLSSSAPDAPWVPPVRAQIEAVAQAAGVKYTLPPLSDGGALNGPTAEDIENAADMTPQERQEMIRGMVEGLSARLANSGGTAEEWSRLISSLAMLGEMDRATAIWKEAQVIFGATPEAMAIVRGGAVQAGIVQ
ncbi:c-type cytochrome biogenesis protein CcmI [Celeribacter marinus]|uniref:c-type cytochrome biogenesis protein CcmI n=1 Tax=Celeribacter marinus TaxID=1397108 RepID=UPI003F6DA473